MPRTTQSRSILALAAICQGHNAPCHQNYLLGAGGEFITKLVFDFYGNYTLQDLIEATKRLRDAVRGLEKNGQLTPNQAKKALGMKDGSNDYLGTGVFHSRNSPSRIILAMLVLNAERAARNDAAVSIIQ